MGTTKKLANYYDASMFNGQAAKKYPKPDIQKLGKVNIKKIGR